MSFTSILIHVVWSTKERNPVLTKEVRTQLFEHISENAAMKGIYIDRINGWEDHVHCLLKLPATLSLAKTLNLIKGESSNWLNKNRKTPKHFRWNAGYYAGSVSLWSINKVRNYIDNQEEHHAEMNYTDELTELKNELQYFSNRKKQKAPTGKKIIKGSYKPLLPAA